MANLTEILAGLVTQNTNNTPTSSQPSSSSTLPSQPFPNPKGSISAIRFHEDSLELEVADDDEEEFLKMLEEISMKDDVRFEESEGIIKLGDGKQEDKPSMEDEFDSIPEKLSDPGPCMINCKVGNEDLDGCMCDPGACVKDLMFPVDFYILDMPPDTPGRPSHVVLGRPFLKTARFKLDAFEAKPEKLIEGKALQDSVLNATSPMSTHSKDNALVSSEGLRYVPPPLRQATKRGINSPWMRDKKGMKDKRKLDEPGKKKSVKASGVKTNVSRMEWNHSTNLSELKGQPLKFHDDHSHNKGVDAYLPPSNLRRPLSFFRNHPSTIATAEPTITASPNLSSSSTFGHPNRRTHHSEPPRRRLLLPLSLTPPPNHHPLYHHPSPSFTNTIQTHPPKWPNLATKHHRRPNPSSSPSATIYPPTNTETHLVAALNFNNYLRKSPPMNQSCFFPSLSLSPLRTHQPRPIIT
ncbi:hypothetical protein PIB30_085885 [Stylosanthes scabra]|uniref:Uncharacterized protein n=1 Tax=Stylosanthes scabra TaxID=79078 RepID=A0ABU6VRQ3_9FABA|nr:hypothetical protein [Stylosanthes scabra]